MLVLISSLQVLISIIHHNDKQKRSEWCWCSGIRESRLWMMTAMLKPLTECSISSAHWIIFSCGNRFSFGMLRAGADRWTRWSNFVSVDAKYRLARRSPGWPDSAEPRLCSSLFGCKSTWGTKWFVVCLSFFYSSRLQRLLEYQIFTRFHSYIYYYYYFFTGQQKC